MPLCSKINFGRSTANVFFVRVSVVTQNVLQLNACSALFVFEVSSENMEDIELGKLNLFGTGLWMHANSFVQIVISWLRY